MGESLGIENTTDFYGVKFLTEREQREWFVLLQVMMVLSLVCVCECLQSTQSELVPLQ